MPYNTWLSERLRSHFANRRDIVEKKLFGGLGFLLAGNLCVCVWQDSLILRLGEAGAKDVFSRPGVRPFDITGKPMSGWAMIDAADLEEQDNLVEWVEKCVAFVGELPAKTADARASMKPPKKAPKKTDRKNNAKAAKKTRR